MSWARTPQAVPTLNFLREFTKFERLDIPSAFNDFFRTFAQGLYSSFVVVLQLLRQFLLVGMVQGKLDEIGDEVLSTLII